MGPNFLNFGKVTRGKKILILVIWNVRIRKTVLFFFYWFIFFKEANEGSKRKIHK